MKVGLHPFWEKKIVFLLFTFVCDGGGSDTEFRMCLREEELLTDCFLSSVYILDMPDGARKE